MPRASQIDYTDDNGFFFSSGVYSTETMTSQKTFFAFQRFGYHVSVEHDEKHRQPKFGGNRFVWARDIAA